MPGAMMGPKHGGPGMPCGIPCGGAYLAPGLSPSPARRAPHDARGAGLTCSHDARGKRRRLVSRPCPGPLRALGRRRIISKNLGPGAGIGPALAPMMAGALLHARGGLVGLTCGPWAPLPSRQRRHQRQGPCAPVPKRHQRRHDGRPLRRLQSPPISQARRGKPCRQGRRHPWA